MKKMNGIGLAMVLLAGNMLMTACSSGVTSLRNLDDDTEVTEYRGVKNFEKIEINGSPQVFYTQADSFSVRVVGSEAAVDNFISEVNGQTLLLRNRGKMGVVNISFSDDDEVEVYVTSPDLTSVNLNGSGDFISSQKVDTDRLDLSLRGSGDIHVSDVICDDCHVELVGSGDVDVDRLEARNVSASVIGSGDVELSLYRVNTTKLYLKGSGDMEVDFVEGCGALDCNLHGSGDIKLGGSLDKLDLHKNGSGTIDTGSLSVRN